MVTKAECLQRFDHALSCLRDQFRLLEDALPPPVMVEIVQGRELRYKEPLIEHAILMKLARSITLTAAMRELVDSGYIIEQGILQRAADETEEDIFFLAFGSQEGLRRIHKDYLRLFWREEFETSTKPKGHRPRPMVRRREIRECLHAQAGVSGAEGVQRFLYSVFSGYVHGASTHIFELLDRRTGRYRLAGIRDDTDSGGYLFNAAMYPFRALMAGVVAARSIGEAGVADTLMDRVKEYEIWLATAE